MQLKHLSATLALFLAAYVGNAAAVGTLIPAATRADMVHDAQRGVVYISASDKVLRYDVASNAFLPPIEISGGQLRGLDLSADSDTLAVADGARSETEVWVHLIDLDTLAITKKTAPRAFYEGGTFTVTFAADGSLLETGEFEGSGGVPMRRLDATSTQWRDVANVRQNTMLTASGDANTIAFAEANSSDGPWGLYDAVTQQVVRRQGYTDGTSWSNFEIGTNALGSQFAIPTYGGTIIYDDAYKQIGKIGAYAGPQPIGVAYHPVENRVYFPWAQTREVKVFDTTTLTEVASYDFEDTFAHTGNRAFQQGRTKLSRDGSLLLVSVNGGVRMHQLYTPLAAANLTASTLDGAPVTVALQGSIGNNGSLSYSVASPPAHGAITLVEDQATYTPVAGYQGEDSFIYRVSYGRATVDARVTVTSTISNRAPEAGFGFVAQELTATFTDTSTDSDGRIVAWLWDFGDGTTSTIANPQHTYAASGTYNVTLTATDDRGASASQTRPVTVIGVQTYANTSDYAISDFNTVQSPITVSGRAGNGAVATPVTVSIVHTYIGDLIVDLVAPDGSAYRLHNRSGGSADNISKTYNVDLSSEPLNGIWKLRVTDKAAQDIGYIDSWSIKF